jgi:hypothetical protein
MRLASAIGVAAIGVLMLPGCAPASADTNVEPSESAATIGLPAGLKKQAPVDGDSALMVEAEGPQHGLRITPLNPAPGLGAQTSGTAYDLCSLLNFAGESGWRLLTRSEAYALSRLKVMLVPGYGSLLDPRNSDHPGEAWVQVTKQEKSDEIAAAEQLHDATGGMMDFMLIGLGFTKGGAADYDRYHRAKADLARAISSGHGGDLFEFAHWDIARGFMDPQRDMVTRGGDPFDVICAKQ